MLRYFAPAMPLNVPKKAPRPDRRFNLHHNLSKQGRMISICCDRVSRSEKVDPLAHDFIEITGGVKPAIDKVAHE